ncbi:MAG: hypothetical protein HOM01_08945 [Kordiimonadaceae bacterium]|nr:hypothetical protein [Kordiimonadaceae bacterium]
MKIIFCLPRIIILLILLLCLSACNTTSHLYGADNIISQQELLNAKVVFDEPLKPSELPEYRIISLNKEMEEFLDKYVLTARGEEKKARLLLKAMFDKDKLGMVYDPSSTYTAEEAFEKKIGNCLSFSYLYAAFAKRTGLNMRFQEVEIPLEWSLGTDQISLSTRHTNIRLIVNNSHDFIVDIDSIGIGNHYKTLSMTENEILALYYSNLGSQYLLAEQYDDAFKYIIKALYLSPEDASVWTILGVLYRLKGYNDYAEHAHFIALKYDVKNYPALNNLAFLYKQTGELEKADYFMKQSKDFQEKDPYYRYYKAIEALNEEKYYMALDHINFSIDRYEEEAKFYMVKSDIYTALGDIRMASKAMASAQKFAQN